jgi:hypothetical protein
VIPWWGWLAMWSSLVLVLLIVLVLAGWLLFRKFMRVLDDFEQLADTTLILDEATSEGLVRSAVSILEPFSAALHRRSSRVYRAKELRTEKRRARLVRARSIIAVDATTLLPTRARRQ